MVQKLKEYLALKKVLSLAILQIVHHFLFVLVGNTFLVHVALDYFGIQLLIHVILLNIQDV